MPEILQIDEYEQSPHLIGGQYEAEIVKSQSGFLFALGVSRLEIGFFLEEFFPACKDVAVDVDCTSINRRFPLS